ncbi:MAG: DEAD/DEAH box helicase family protein [Brooklawnia sp.]|nr:DEAD/DEAH box helicase family protein [Brooklawnia sp.]
MEDALADPVLNGPFDPPSRYFEIGPKGPTGTVLPGRRPSESFIPVPQTKKRGRKAAAGVQETLDFDLTHERVEKNTLINDIRSAVDVWRMRGYEGATPTTRKLLLHWADPQRENRVLFCQREAAETAIYLAEVAGRRVQVAEQLSATSRPTIKVADWRERLDAANAEHNDGLPRVALKMATGSGKTVVMAMLIAWNTLNKVATPSDKRFAKRFLVVTPGITIRDRLRVLDPSEPGNYYDLRDLVPSQLRADLGQAQIIITNYHVFLKRDAKEIKGVARLTKNILLAGKSVDPFKETDDAVVSRVLRGWGVSTGRQQTEIVVFNDEAHHCYADRPQRVVEVDGAEADGEAKAANEEARVWYKGLLAVANKVGIKAIYDMSATPYYLRGSGYNEGFIFPWTVSDFSLMDAIESGIVKVPRIPVDDDAADDQVVYLNLWDHIGASRALAKRELDKIDVTQWLIPPQLEGALRSLYRSYERAFVQWEQHRAQLGESPPVFIVVCPNTSVSRLVWQWIAGTQVEGPNGPVTVPGKLPLFNNVQGDRMMDRPHTILIDSAQLESGEAIKADFKAAAASEIELFKSDYRRRNPGADVDAITDEDLLREVMNTVGKPGRLGEPIRCVVSVAMLTEGWDANTVTHILGIRAFRSQLLCEQVVGRGLRRRSYAINDQGRFDAEYASVYGVPFAFIPSDKPPTDPQPAPPATEVRTVPGREHLRITFPNVEAYRLEIPDEYLYLDAASATRYRVGRSKVPTWSENAPIVGEVERIEEESGPLRPQAVAFRLARRLLRHQYVIGSDERPWLFPRLVDICKEWLDQCVDLDDGFDVGTIVRYAEYEADAAEAIYQAVSSMQDDRRKRMRVILRRADPIGSTGSVAFVTRKPNLTTTLSEVSHVVLDGPGGNTWEEKVADLCESGLLPVTAYVKNDHLGFTIPYVHKGRTHAYVPDFLLRLKRRDGDVDRTLIVEVSGGMKSAHAPGSVQAKAETARHSWCAGVNNHGGFGRWGYVELTDITTALDRLREAIDSLYADGPIIGDPDLLDYAEVNRGS